MELRGYLRALRKYWWIVLTCLVLSVGAGVFVTLRAEPQYESSVTFFVQTPSETSALQGDAFGQKRVNSYIQLANSQRLADRLIADTGLKLTANQLSSRISASGDLNTVILTVKVTDTVPTRGLLIATSISTQFVELVAEIEQPAAGGVAPVKLEVVSGPSLNPDQVSPRPVLNIGIAGLVGLLLGLGLAVLREVLDNSIRGVDELQQYAKSPVIGVIAYDESASKSPLIVDSGAKSNRAESFRQLRTNLQFVNVDHPPRVVVVTSAMPDEGKSSTSTNLAITFAEAGRKVLLMEADLRRPRVADYLGLEGSVGLTNVLAGQVDLQDVLQTWGRGGLTVLTSGAIPPNPSELLGSKAMDELLRSVLKVFDLVIIDSPPLLPVTDAAVIAARADGALLVVRHGKTSRNQVEVATTALATVDARLIGTVLNMVPTKGADAYSYQYGYAYYEDTVERGKLTDFEHIEISEQPRTGSAGRAADPAAGQHALPTTAGRR